MPRRSAKHSESPLKAQPQKLLHRVNLVAGLAASVLGHCMCLRDCIRTCLNLNAALNFILFSFRFFAQPLRSPFFAFFFHTFVCFLLILLHSHSRSYPPSRCLSLPIVIRKVNAPELHYKRMKRKKRIINKNHNKNSKRRREAWD